MWLVVDSKIWEKRLFAALFMKRQQKLSSVVGPQSNPLEIDQNMKHEKN